MESSLQQLAQQRNRQFLRLFAANEAAVYGFVRSQVPRREDAGEIMQEIAVVLWEKFDEFDATRDFRKWAYGVARYEVLAYFRDRQRDLHVFDESLLAQIVSDAMEDDTGEARRAALELCLEKLQPRQRQLVLEAYRPGTRIDVLAEQRGQTAMSMYKLLHRIRLSLHECIERSLTRESLA